MKVFYYLPGTGPDMGPGNRSSWAYAYFPDLDSGPDITIQGLTIEEEAQLTGQHPDLPPGSEPLGCWLDDGAYIRGRVTIFRKDGIFFLEALVSGWGGHPEECEELPSPDGVAFSLKPRHSSRRFVVYAGGKLEIYDDGGRLIVTPRKIR